MEAEVGGDPEPAQAAALPAPPVRRRAGEALSPREFWLDHISQRVPVVIEGHLEERAWKARKWTNDYMSYHAVLGSSHMDA